MIKLFKQNVVIHYLILGAIIFGFVNWQESKSGQINEIIISNQYQQQLFDMFEHENFRYPSTDEQKQILEGIVKQEVLWREAQKQGLSKNDEVIRRRLVTKMSFMLESLAKTPEPTEQELMSFHAMHKEQYVLPARYHISHVMFNDYQTALNAHQQVLSGKSSFTTMSTEGIQFLHGQHFKGMTKPELDRIFGLGFTAKLVYQESGLTGPISSKFGVHIVKITKHEPERLASFSEANTEIYKDWLAEEKSKSEQKIYQQWQQSYTVTVQPISDSHTHSAQEVALR